MSENPDIETVKKFFNVDENKAKELIEKGLDVDFLKKFFENGVKIKDKLNKITGKFKKQVNNVTEDFKD